MTALEMVPGFTPLPTTASITFTRLSRIGAGQGMNSEVYLIHDHQLDTQLAMKFVSKAKVPHAADYFAEARRLHDTRHRHVVDVKYACSDETQICLAMPYYRSGTLHTLLDQRYLTVRQIVQYGLEFLSGLHHVHVKGIVHLDVKPTNILLDDSDTAAVADFGLSREVTGHGLADMPYVYVPHIPPERLTASEVSKSADVYQAGLTLYRMCVGNEEFERQMAVHGSRLHEAVAAGTFPDRQRFLGHIPPRLRDVVTRATALNPDDRFLTVLDLMNALALVEESLDWRYHADAVWGDGKWVESGLDGGGRRVAIQASGATWDVHACHVAASGRERRAVQFCQHGLAESAARRLVRKALKGLWR